MSLEHVIIGYASIILPIVGLILVAEGAMSKPRYSRKKRNIRKRKGVK